MPDKIVRLEKFKRKAAMSPLGKRALDMVEFMGRSGLTTTPRNPTDEMVAAGMAVSGISEAQVRAIFTAMIAAYDADEPGVAGGAG